MWDSLNEEGCWYDDRISDISKSYDEDCIDSDVEVILYGQIHHESNPDCNNTVEINGQTLKANVLDSNNAAVEEEQITNTCAVEDLAINERKIENYMPDLHERVALLNEKTETNSCTAASSDKLKTKRKNLSEVGFCRKKKKFSANINSNANSLSSENLKECEVIVNENNSINLQCLPDKQRTNKVKRKCTSSSSSESDFHTNKNFKTDIQINLNNMTTEMKMRKFYDSDCDDLDIKKELEKMSDDSWHLDERDAYKHMFKKSQQYRYHNHLMRVTCNNCQEQGHLSKVCTKPRKLVTCFLCGQIGHLGDNCRDVACTRCLAVGHQVARCMWRVQDVRRKCPICSMRGHLRNECPDLWRRFHATIVPGTPVKGTCKTKNRKNVYCYNCAKKGHYGHECQQQRFDPHNFPTWPFVISYLDPSVSLTTESKKKNGKNDDGNYEMYLKRLEKKKESIIKRSKRSFLRYIQKKRNQVTNNGVKRGLEPVRYNIKNENNRRGKNSTRVDKFNGKVESTFPRTPISRLKQQEKMSSELASLLELHKEIVKNKKNKKKKKQQMKLKRKKKMQNENCE
ncbi:zinc finger CCHC domain-containing protein 7-like [Limulus polyphemus]|uniref:Zinc finger CCHC domain-containing protein 7 n=1 Tax=Limulus polyphemus TaxID=6850 RepID=A0ABM1TJ60_LIMPO|nr:zinc finger CCHC domain-containing protein 7-like [Limulus polyphemus]XP_013786888.1 zinc finger CCHC domain-containing protein 7-like [Limulus polyphemus]XP_022255912.1 zinc finger CCHC domain-containing protein 7-like [Limulus polyphemus]XP_022255916.1 zinc finger CCHC domain-containing protein 7-like [Limulus polyphemus]